MKHKFQNCFKNHVRYVLIQQFMLNCLILYTLKLFFERGNYICYNVNYESKMYKNIHFSTSSKYLYTDFVVYFSNK